MSEKDRRSARVRRVSQNSFLEMTRLKATARREGRLKCDLSHGVPDIAPPARLLEKFPVFARKPEDHNRLTFTRPDGKLARAMDHYGRQLAAGDISAFGKVLSAGSKEIIYHLSLALLDPGDVVLIPEIAYPYYQSSAEFAGARVVSYPLSPNDGRPMTDGLPSDLLAAAKLMWVTNPHNPTGAVLDKAGLESVVRFCRHHDVVLCHDVVYRAIVHEAPPVPSLLAQADGPQNLIEIHSLSKVLSIAGWRVALTFGDPALINAVRGSLFLASNGLFLVLQNAVRYALVHYETFTREIAQRYSKRVRAFSETLAGCGVKHRRPRGGYYFWLPVPEGRTDMSCVETILERTGILLFPGSAFGEAGSRFFRVSLVRPAAELIHAAEAIATSGIYPQA